MSSNYWRHLAWLFVYFFFGLPVVGPDADESHWICKLSDQTIRCSSDLVLSNTAHEELEQTLKSALSVRQRDACTINKFDGEATGAIDSLHITQIEMLLGYSCDIPADPTKSTYRVQERGTERYNFNCGTKEFKFYASGFDKYNDGKWLHWDSQGTARPIPWRPILVGDAMTKSVFDQICK